MSDDSTRAEFQRRRANTWRLAKPWSLLMAVSWLGEFAVLSLPDLSNQTRLNIFFPLFIVIAVSIVVPTVIVQRHYRCPECGSIPRTHRGVLLNPSECPECGAELK